MLCSKFLNKPVLCYSFIFSSSKNIGLTTKKCPNALKKGHHICGTKKCMIRNHLSGDSHPALKMCVNFHKQKYLKWPSEFACP